MAAEASCDALASAPGADRSLSEISETFHIVRQLQLVQRGGLRAAPSPYAIAEKAPRLLARSQGGAGCIFLPSRILASRPYHQTLRLRDESRGISTAG